MAEYAELARAAIDDVHGARPRRDPVRRQRPLPARGAAPLELPPAPADGVRERYQRLYDQRGAGAAHALLAELDPAAAAAVHENDRRRVVRALELADAGATLAPAADALWLEPPEGTVILGLQVPADTVRERIEARTRAMFELGVEREVAAAVAAGPLSATAARIHGLSDVRALLDGEIDRDEAIAAPGRAHPPVRAAPAGLDAAPAGREAGGRAGRSCWPRRRHEQARARRGARGP